MIIGAHVMIQSRDDKADMEFLSDILKLSSVDAGDGFLIYGLPPAEIAVHAGETNGSHQLFLMCKNIDAFAKAMTKRGVAYSAPQNRGWGTLTEITLPGGGMLGVYQPHHKRPKANAAAGKKKAPARKPAKKKAAKKKKAKRR